MSEEILQAVFESNTAKGIIALVILGIFIIIYLVTDKKRAKATPKAMTASAIAVALGFILNQLVLFKMPYGGAVTPFSMLIVILIGYFFGVRQGVLAGVAFGLLDLLINPYVLSPVQLLLDYPIAYGALGLGGFFMNRNSVIPAYLAGVLGRFICSFLSGVIFFGMYAPEGFNAVTWSLVYNATYMGTEAVLTVVVLCIPVVKKAIRRIAKILEVPEQTTQVIQG